jgi:two-component system KDP operon response regulator KdpE
MADKTGALDASADDHLVRPVGAAELLALVRAQLRRLTLTSASADPVLRFGAVTVDLARRLVERHRAPVHPTPIEHRLLTHLASQPGRVVTHQQLLKAVWGPRHVQDTHDVRVHLADLRKKVENGLSMPKQVLTEAGVGYRFSP